MEYSVFEAFIGRHRQRHPFARLPSLEDGKLMYQTWYAQLRLCRIADVEVIDEASARLVLKPPRSDKVHFQTLCEYALDIQKARGGKTLHDLSSREGAEAASKGCDRGCAGTGLTVVWHRAPDRDARIAETSAAYCVCALGRWIERNHSAKCPEIRKRMVDLKDVIEGRGVWLADPPEVVQEVSEF